MKSAFRVADWQFHSPPATVKSSQGGQSGIAKVGEVPSPRGTSPAEASSVGERTGWDGVDT